MRKTVAIYLLSAAIVPFASQPVVAEVVYRAGEGWSTQAPGAEGASVEATASAQLRKAQEAEQAGELKRALDAYRGLVRKFPNSGVAARAQIKVGELYEKTGDFDRAYEAYGTYVTKYPKGEEFERAVEARFHIAKRFLEGEKRRLLGVKTFSSMARAQQMFEAIVRDAPFSQFAAQAQFYVGQALEKQEKDAEAIAAYQTVLSRYPNDPAAADAQYQIGYVHFRNARKAFDKAEANRAREAFEDFVARYPGSEKVPQARENLNILSGRETGNAMNVAKFYDKQKNYKAAVIYYNDVIKQQPDSPDAELAKNRIAELKNKVGEDALRAGPERTETGARAEIRRRLQAQVDTAARPDYSGPPVSMPTPTPDELAPGRPKLRTTPEDVGPIPAVEPALPE